MRLSRNLRSRALIGVTIVMSLVALMPVAPALATHNTCELDLTPEGPAPTTLGTTHTITASLRPAGTDPNSTSTANCTTRDGGPVDVLFEVSSNDTSATYSPTSIDRQSTVLQPDLGCTIPANANSCTVSYTRTAATGTDTIVGWVADEDTVQDTVTKTWTAPQAAFLDLSPETDSNPPQTAHVVTATVRDGVGNLVSGVNVDFEITSGPNANLDTTRADRECVTGTDGTCTISYTDAATNPAPPGNVDSICGWLDPENDDVFSPFTSDAADGGDCDVEALEESDDSPVAGSDSFGNDATDRVSKTWQPPTLTVSPSSDTASVGTCNPFTLTLLSGSNAPTSNVTLDVEQVHSLATNNVSGDEPRVSFCTPTTADGPNPSGVDENRGDLRESPDNEGTAGGETSNRTDSNGRITIGIFVEPTQNASGVGSVSLTAWNDTTDNDDPDSAEIRGTATKTWVAAEARTIDCEPEASSAEVGGIVTITCTVRDRFGAALAGQPVVIGSTGVGAVPGEARLLTDSAGQVTASATSFQLGTQVATGTIEADLLGAEPTEVDPCDRAAGDPSGAPTGVCADDVSITWTLPTTGTPVPTACQTAAGAFIGTDGNDVITGTTGNDVICGRGGDDTLRGLGGIDSILGGAGDDTILGAAGQDRLAGGGDADTISGGADSDAISGNAGNDVLTGRAGNDTIRGNTGNDQLAGGRGNDTLLGGTGRDTCATGPGRDRTSSC